MLTRRWVSWSIVGIVAACGSGKSPVDSIGRPPVLVGDDAGGDDAPASDDSSTADGASGDGAGDGGDAGEAGPVFPPQCALTSSWGTIQRVASIPSAGFDRFGAISSNGLTAAWTTAAGQVEVADRASISASFGPPSALATGTIQLANDRVALAQGGLKLVATLADHSSFVAFARLSTSAAWNPALSGEFKNLASMLTEGGGALSSPVVGADGQTLFYLVAIGTALPILYESTWSTSAKVWQPGNPLPNPDFLITSASMLRRPTGGSYDRRTFFFFDEVSGHERAAWRASPSAPFDTFMDLPMHPEAVPDASCTTLYFRGSDATGQGLFTGSGP
jgi:hypothetical protein